MSIDDTLLTHAGKHFGGIAYLYDSTQGCYNWAHNLVTLHYSDEETDYTATFELWRPPDVERLETGLAAARVAPKASKQERKRSDPNAWRAYVLGVWRRLIRRRKLISLCGRWPVNPQAIGAKAGQGLASLAGAPRSAGPMISIRSVQTPPVYAGGTFSRSPRLLIPSEKLPPA